MDLLSDLLAVGDVATWTEVNLENNSAGVLESVISLDVPIEAYGKPPQDVIPESGVLVVNRGEKKKRTASKLLAS